MEPIYQKRVGAYVMSSPIWTNLYVPGIFASRPMSKLEMFRDRLIISILGKKFEINYKDIDFIERKRFRIRIHHHCDNLDKWVFLAGAGTGIKLFKEIKDVIENNGLPISVS